MRVGGRFGAALAACVLIACSSERAILEPNLSRIEVGDIIEQLRNAGATVVNEGPMSPGFYDAPGTLLRVDGEAVHIYEFESEEAAEAASSLRPLVQWTAPPHFYHRAQVIALYVGSTGTLLNRLKVVFGAELD